MDIIYVIRLIRNGIDLFCYIRVNNLNMVYQEICDVYSLRDYWYGLSQSGLEATSTNEKLTFSPKTSIYQYMELDKKC